MVAKTLTFSAMFSKLIEEARTGNLQGFYRSMEEIEARLNQEDAQVRETYIALLNRIRKMYDHPEVSPDGKSAEAPVETRPIVNQAPDSITGSQSGVSVVTCCMNRTENLIRAIRSWLPHSQINEIVIVDWNSDEPVRESLQRERIEDPRIQIVRAIDEPRWILSFAFNLGFRYANYNKILKVDADIVLSEDFFDKNSIFETEFLTGHWEIAEPGQEHINGFFFANTAHLGAIKGFNEFITTYGWDDDDIYERLVGFGAARKLVDPKTIRHLDHDDAQRIGRSDVEMTKARQQLARDTLYKIRRNRFIANVMPAWNCDRLLAPFDVYEESPKYVELRRRKDDLPHFVSDDIEAQADFFAAMELVSWKCGTHTYHFTKQEFDTLIDSYTLEQLEQGDLYELLDQAPTPAGDSQPTPDPQISRPFINTGRPKLFIDGQHGLGNRMRAIGSGAAVAEKTDRELVIVWEPDHHCEGRMSDLFDYDGAVIEQAFWNDADAQGVRLYNYMEVEENSEKDAFVEADASGDIYIRSAYVLNSPHTNWDAENTFLKNLRPVEGVLDLVNGVRTPNDVTAHVRMVGGSEYEHLAYEATDNWTEEGHQETDYWRRRSHFSHFMKRIDALMAEKGVDRVFLAADKPETYEEFIGAYGDKLAYLPRELYDRSADQLRYALADALLLGSAPLLLGSTWSSFSELAMRLSPQKMNIEMSGTDF